MNLARLRKRYRDMRSPEGFGPRGTMCPLTVHQLSNRWRKVNRQRALAGRMLLAERGSA